MRVHVSMHILRAQHVSLFVCLYKEWGACVHVSARINQRASKRICLRFESWTCLSMCVHTLRADQHLNVSRAESVSAFVCAC